MKNSWHRTTFCINQPVIYPYHHGCLQICFNNEVHSSNILDKARIWFQSQQKLFICGSRLLGNQNFGPRQNCRHIAHDTFKCISVNKNCCILIEICCYGLNKRNKTAAISQVTFSNAVSLMKIFVFWFKFYRSLLLRVQMTINQHWFG